MPAATDNQSQVIDRRSPNAVNPGIERRQFGNTYQGLSPEAHELATAIDAYKLRNRRRYITFEEMHDIIHSLGYRKSDA